MECIDQTLQQEDCFVCGELAIFVANKYHCKCPEHTDFIWICGAPEKICQGCIEKGWVSVSGSGGGTGARNYKTKEFKEKVYRRAKSN